MDNMKPSKQQPQQDADGEQGIPVAELYFCTGYRNPDLPISESRGGLGRLQANDDKGISITLLPRRQEFKVVELSRDSAREDKVCYVPKSWAAWVPLSKKLA